MGAKQKSLDSLQRHGAAIFVAIDQMQLAWVPRAAAQDFSSGPELKQNEKELWFWGGPRQNCVAANLFHVWPWEMSLLIIIYLMYDTFTWILKRLLSFLLEKHQ